MVFAGKSVALSDSKLGRDHLAIQLGSTNSALLVMMAFPLTQKGDNAQDNPKTTNDA